MGGNQSTWWKGFHVNSTQKGSGPGSAPATFQLRLELVSLQSGFCVSLNSKALLGLIWIPLWFNRWQICMLIFEISLIGFGWLLWLLYIIHLINHTIQICICKLRIIPYTIFSYLIRQNSSWTLVSLGEKSGKVHDAYFLNSYWVSLPPDTPIHPVTVCSVPQYKEGKTLKPKPNYNSVDMTEVEWEDTDETVNQI